MFPGILKDVSRPFISVSADNSFSAGLNCCAHVQEGSSASARRELKSK